MAGPQKPGTSYICIRHLDGSDRTYYSSCYGCLPDSEAWERDDFVPNSQCPRYYGIPVRTMHITESGITPMQPAESMEAPAEYRKASNA